MNSKHQHWGPQEKFARFTSSFAQHKGYITSITGWIKRDKEKIYLTVTGFTV
jgi:hypothetical protein